MMRRCLPVVLLFAGATACTGDLGEPPPPEEPDQEPVLEPLSVPASPDVVAGDGFCVSLANGEQFWSVSPEGHAWLAQPTEESQLVRVIDPFDAENEVAEELLLDELRQLHAWSDADAAVITATGLWRLENMARIQIIPPVDVSDAVLCGDPGQNGLLLLEGSLYERRDDQWFVWDSDQTDDAAPSTLVTYDGECQSTANATWMSAGDGTLWKLLASEVRRPQQFEPGAATTATAELVAVLETERLVTGPDEWQPWVFEGDTPTVLAASGGALWLAAGSQLMRFDGESFVEVSHPHEGTITRIAAHAGGAWLIGDSAACHVSTGPMIRVEGVRAYSRSTELIYPFLVTASEADLDITASIDGEDIELTVDDETGWLGGTARIDDIGWGDLLIEADGTSRHIPVKRLPEVTRSWADDVQPIYQDHCTGNDCHGSDTPDVPDLGTYDAWISYADAIRTRVVDAQTMPPPASRTEEWGDEQVEIITEWLEGGMLP